jgi:hypothetical protein
VRLIGAALGCIAVATQILGTEGVERAAVTADGEAVDLQLLPDAHWYPCDGIKTRVDDGVEVRQVEIAPPSWFPYYFEGRRLLGGLCDYNTCQPARPMRLGLSEYRVVREQSGVPVLARAPLAGHITFTRRYFHDAACTQAATMKIELERHPPASTLLPDDPVRARLAQGGLANATIVARWPEEDTGRVVIVRGRRGGVPELVLAQTDAATTPLVLAHAAPLSVELGSLLDLPELVDVQAHHSEGSSQRTLHHIVRLGARPVELCGLPQATLDETRDHTHRQRLRFARRAGPELTFAALYDDKTDAQPEVSREELWRIDATGCTRLSGGR